MKKRKMEEEEDGETDDGVGEEDEGATEKESKRREI